MLRRLSSFGSGQGCFVRLDSSKVSPTHCAIVNPGDRVILRDLASKTGTLVNGWEGDARELTGRASKSGGLHLANSDA